MKEIEAIIQPHMLTKMMDALHAVPHFPGATVSDCQGQGRGRGRGRGRGTGGQVEARLDNNFFVKKVKLEIFCADEVCDELVQLIQRNAHTGNPGDGIVMVADVSRVVRARTAEEQDRAV